MQMNFFGIWKGSTIPQTKHHAVKFLLNSRGNLPGTEIFAVKQPHQASGNIELFPRMRKKIAKLATFLPSPRDPSRASPRIIGMLTSVDTLDTPPAALTGSEYFARAIPKGRRTEIKNVSSSQNNWIAQMYAVRDEHDQAAFAELFAHFAPRVKAFLMKGGADPSLAEECAQEVMATVWRKAHMFDPGRASVATWVFTIARNKKIDALRKQRRPEPEDLAWGPEEEPDQVDAIGLAQETEKLAEAIAQLPKKQRVLIESAYFGDLSHSEIADATGLPLGTIKSRIRLALDRLRHAMK